jgi:plasmid stability protein
MHCYHLPALLASAINMPGTVRGTRIMASLSVRQLDEETLRQLRLRAARHGVSTEEEVRRILRRAVAAPERLGDLALAMFGPAHGVELELPQRTPHQPVDLEPLEP